MGDFIRNRNSSYCRDFNNNLKTPAGYVGVVYSPNGGVKENALNQGWHFVNPLYKVTEYTVATEQAYLSRDSKEGSKDDDSFYIPTSDGNID